MKNLSLNPDLKKLPFIESCACSDEIGEALFFSRGGNSQSSLVRSGVEFSPEHKSEEIPVAIVTLDSYLSRATCQNPVV